MAVSFLQFTLVFLVFLLERKFQNEIFDIHIFVKVCDLYELIYEIYDISAIHVCKKNQREYVVYTA